MSRVRVCGVALGLGILAAVALASGQTGAPPAAGAVIKGTVVDDRLAPLPGAAVTLEQADRILARQVTDVAGRFEFDRLRPGAFRVKADLAGFITVTREVTVRAAGDVVSLPLVLRSAGLKQDITVEAAGTAVVGGRGAGAGRATATPPPPPAAASAPPAQQVIGGIAAGAAGGVPNRSTDQFQELRLRPDRGGESYLRIPGNRFRSAIDEPLSTFGADVDTASFTNVRRFLTSGRMPPRDAVRVEELLNYFRFRYAEPTAGRPIALTTEVGECPWAPGHTLVLIGARARPSAGREIEGRNFVLLLDVSGSMAPPERLPMIKTAMAMWVDTLRPDDRVAIVTYAGTSGIALPSTPARERHTIQRAIDRLQAGGSTNGGDGLILAYRTALESFIPGGLNRVILATDGDFNVGIVDRRDLVRLVERERDTGVFLSVFGVGGGNLKDATMELLADRGNGNYAYLDSLPEARRVLIREGDATVETVAKDVKFQVEFNPATVAAWKLIGYEDRALAAEDFNNDRKDGGEMGAGHTVTVLYEIVPAGQRVPDDRSDDRPLVDPLKYQASPVAAPRPAPGVARVSGELLTVKVRYQAPEGSASRLIEQAVRAGGPARYLPFASAVAEFGLLLRDDRAFDGHWDDLRARVRSVPAVTGRESDRETLAELVELAAALRRGRR